MLNVITENFLKKYKNENVIIAWSHETNKSNIYLASQSYGSHRKRNIRCEIQSVKYRLKEVQFEQT